MEQYYIAKNGENLGSFTADQINERLKTGEFLSEDLIFNEANNEWIPLSQAGFQQVKPVDLAPPFKSKASLWNPNSAVNWSLLFGPLFGQVLHYLNWRNLNEPGRAKNALIWAGFGVIIPLAWLLFIPLVTLISPASTPNLILLVGIYQLGLLIVWAFSYGGTQTKFVKRKFAKDYVRQKWGKPLLIGLGYIVLLMMVTAFNDSLLLDHIEGEATSAPQVSEEKAVDSVSKASPEPTARAKRYQTITGVLPLSLSPDENIEYTIEGLFLMQNAEGFWLTDLLPKEVLRNFPTPETYPSGQEAATFQILLNKMVRSNLYKPGLQRVILIPRDKTAYDRINLPAQQTFITAEGEFVKYQSIEMADGSSARLPVFVVDSVKLWDRKYFDLSGK